MCKQQLFWWMKNFNNQHLFQICLIFFPKTSGTEEHLSAKRSINTVTTSLEIKLTQAIIRKSSLAGSQSLWNMGGISLCECVCFLWWKHGVPIRNWQVQRSHPSNAAYLRSMRETKWRKSLYNFVCVRDKTYKFPLLSDSVSWFHTYSIFMATFWADFEIHPCLLPLHWAVVKISSSLETLTC